MFPARCPSLLRTKCKIWTKSDNFLLLTKIWGVYKKRKRSPWMHYKNLPNIHKSQSFQKKITIIIDIVPYFEVSPTVLGVVYWNHPWPSRFLQQYTDRELFPVVMVAFSFKEDMKMRIKIGTSYATTTTATTDTGVSVRCERYNHYKRLIVIARWEFKSMKLSVCLRTV